MELRRPALTVHLTATSRTYLSFVIAGLAPATHDELQ